MPPGTLTVKPQFVELYGPLARTFIGAMALALTAAAIFGGLIESSGVWRLVICLFVLVFNSVVLFASFTYTQFDDHQIAKVFRFGPLRFDYHTVKWDDVTSANIRAGGRNRSVIYLTVTKKNGQKIIFSALPNSAGAINFEEIVRYFQKVDSTEHA